MPHLDDGEFFYCIGIVEAFAQECEGSVFKNGKGINENNYLRINIKNIKLLKNIKKERRSMQIVQRVQMKMKPSVNEKTTEYRMEYDQRCPYPETISISSIGLMCGEMLIS